MGAKKQGTGELVRKGLVMILSQVPGVEKTFEGVQGMDTNPLGVYVELSGSHPQRDKPLYYSVGYTLASKGAKGYTSLDVLEMRAHAHETEESRTFLTRFEGLLADLFPEAEALRPELLETNTAKRVYRWWLPVADVIRYATCEDTPEDG